MFRYFWFALGVIALIIGFMGIFLPLLPTVPLVLLAAFSFAKSSPRLHDWMMSHKTFGPMIRDWQANGAIARRAKYLATLSIVGAFSISVFLGLPAKLLIIQAVVLSCVLIFIWTRPD